MNKLLALMVLGFAVVLTGCNTWHGFGKDLEKVGDKIQNSPNN
ncbi:MAG: entericidin A/B family lipoprotein [Methylotenera sp.]|nr:entericidin A/B family lipoprotein [Methylophilus sp.]MDP3607890.1 entericidin A/B family lipoprotein [Methylophilus sp.]MDZ4211679.1 entericidin A/B family lipoprotein [Methylotenera sp.]